MVTHIADFKDLRVWQAAMDLAVAAHKVALGLPSQERFALSDQIRRSAYSVPSNIAEGYGRRSRGDYVRFLRVANGSPSELETQLLLTERLGMVGFDDLGSALGLCTRTEQMLTALIRSLMV